MRFSLLLLLLLWPLGALASGRLDPAFGGDGYVTLGVTANQAQRNDEALAACAGPQGSLFVLGVASEATRIASAWVTEGGALDTRFGQLGQREFALDRPTFDPVASCLPSGRVALAMEQLDAQGDGSLVVMLIDPATGLPDPAFGVGGRLEVNLDSFATGLGDLESPRVVSPGRNGELLVGGRYTLAPPSRVNHGLVLRVSASGTLLAHHLTHQHGANNSSFHAVLPTAAGELWAATSFYDGTLSHARIERLRESDLAPLGTLHADIGDDVTPSRGVMLDPHTMALSGVRRGGRPVAMLVRTEGVFVLELPTPTHAPLVTFPQIAGTAEGGLLFAAGVRPMEGVPSGQYFVHLRRAGVDRLRVNPSFGHAGTLVVRHPAVEQCGGAEAEQNFRRFTYWNGRPTFVGRLDVKCAGAGPDFDYLIGRLEFGVLFGDGFED